MLRPEDEDIDPEHEAELMAASLELDPLVRLFREDRWEDVCEALHDMDPAHAKRLLGFSIAVMGVALADRERPQREG